MNDFTGNISSPEVPDSINLTSKVLSFWNPKTYLLCIHLLVGVPTNSYVLWLIATGRGIAFEFFIFNLIFCEIFYCLQSLVYMLVPTVPCLAVLQRGLQALVMSGRALFECLVCVERYLAVVHPVTFLKFKPLRYKLICSAAAWIVSLVFCSGRMITFTLLEGNAHVLFFSSLFLILLPIQLFLLLSVLRALRQSGPGERGREREEENFMKRRAFNLILITTVNMVIMFTPYIVTGFFTVLTHQEDTISWFISILCFVLTAFVQPVLYLHRVGKLFCFGSLQNLQLRQNKTM